MKKWPLITLGFCLSLLLCSDCSRTPSSNSGSFSFAVFGDSQPEDFRIQQTKMFKRILAEIKKRKPDFVIALGDLIAGYQYNEPELRRMWSEYSKAVRVLEPIPLYGVPGNHDIFDEMSGRLWDQYMGRASRFYSVVRKNNAFIFLDSETQADAAAGLQVDWLKGELRKQRGRDHIFVVIHKPVFQPLINGKRKELSRSDDAGQKDRADFLDILGKNGVTAVFAGHVHIYDKEVRNGVLQYISGGMGERSKEVDQNKSFTHYLWVTVEGKAFHVEVVRPDLRNFREETRKVNAPHVIEDFESDDSANSWETWWHKVVRGEAVAAPGGGSGRAYRLDYDLSQYAWPQLTIGLDPLQEWIGAKALSFDLYLPSESAPAKPLDLYVQMSSQAKDGFVSSIQQPKPGWNHFRLPFSENRWDWFRGDDSERRTNVAVQIREISPVGWLEFILAAPDRPETGSIYLDNIRIE